MILSEIVSLLAGLSLVLVGLYGVVRRRLLTSVHRNFSVRRGPDLVGTKAVVAGAWLVVVGAGVLYWNLWR